MHPTGSSVIKRSPLSLIPQQALAAILAQAGYNYSLITDAINEHNGKAQAVTRQQITVDIAQVIADAAPISPEDPLEIKRLQLSRLELISNLALSAFLDSAQVDTDTQTVTDAPDADGKPTQRKTRSKSRKRSAGDAKYLAIMAQIEDQRNRILGAHAPERREEVGELTVTFAWRDAAPLLSTAPPDSDEGQYRLADNGENADADAAIVQE